MIHIIAKSNSFSIIFSIAFGVCIIVNSCNYRNTKPEVKKIREFTVGLGDSTIINSDALVGFYKLYLEEDTVYLYYFDWIDTSICIHNLQSKSQIKILDISNIKRIEFNKRNDVIKLNRDTLALFSDNDQLLILLNKSGREIKRFSTIDRDSELPSYVAVSFGDRGFMYDDLNNDLISQIAYTDMVLSKNEHFAKYFSRPMVQRINLNDSITYSTYVDAPASYKSGKYYGSFNLFKCIGQDNNKFYSFSSCDDIFTYGSNGNVRLERNARSTKKPKFNPFDLNKIKDISYLRKYSMTQAKYQKIIYDEFFNVYYRIFKPKISFLNNENKIRRGHEIPWTIIILNNSFNVITEIEMDPRKYSYKTILPTKEGLIISNRYQISTKKEYLSFSLIKIEGIHENSKK